jgi:hypothetical protein
MNVPEWVLQGVVRDVRWVLANPGPTLARHCEAATYSRASSSRGGVIALTKRRSPSSIR